MMQARAGRAAVAAFAIAALVAGCGGSDDPVTPPAATVPQPVVATKADVVARTAGGIGGVALTGTGAWLSVSNSSVADSGVFKTTLPLQATSTWSGVLMGDCGLAREESGMPSRTPGLRALDSGLWLFQTWADKGPDARPEHALCSLAADAGGFVPRDAGLKVCHGEFCSTLSPGELKQVGNVLYTSAGGGKNVFASNDKGATWHVLTGEFDEMFCYQGTFEVVDGRLIIGGECPLDMAYMESYQLGADGISLASPAPTALTVPNLGNRNVQFIKALGAKRVFAGVEGGLLRSEDGGRSFKFVIENPIEGGTGNYPYIRHVLALAKQPDTIVVAGFDKGTGKPYMAWSSDGGTKWTDISSLLPGYARDLDATSAAMVTSIVEDAQGRIVATVNEQEGAQGRVVLVTLGTPGQ